MNQSLAKSISVLFHPLAMPTYIYGLIWLFAPAILRPFPVSAAPFLLLIIFLSTFLMPALGAWVYHLSGNTSSLEMWHRRERLVPLAFTVIIYGITTYLMKEKMMLNRSLWLIMAGITATVAITAAVTYFWKISAHAIGIGGTWGLVLMIGIGQGYPMLLPFAITSLVLGLVCSARLQLNAHSPVQVLGGLALGSLASMGYLLGF